MAKRYNILTRCLAALALLFVYVASTSAILVGGTTTSAEARGGRGGEAAEEAFAAVAVASIAAAAVASMAAEVMAEVMASMAGSRSFYAVAPIVWVPAAGGTPTASASAGGDIGPIAVA